MTLTKKPRTPLHSIEEIEEIVSDFVLDLSNANLDEQGLIIDSCYPYQDFITRNICESVYETADRLHKLQEEDSTVYHFLMFLKRW